MEKDRKLYSLNDTIYFKINAYGKKILEEQAMQFHKAFPHVDIQYIPEPWRVDKDKAGNKIEWYKQQLHWVFKHFEQQSYVGRLLPIYDLTFEKPI